jgi:hypothetical protein
MEHSVPTTNSDLGLPTKAKFFHKDTKQSAYAHSAAQNGIHNSTLQHITVLESTAQHISAHHCTRQHSKPQHSSGQHSAARQEENSCSQIHKKKTSLSGKYKPEWQSDEEAEQSTSCSRNGVRVQVGMCAASSSIIYGTEYTSRTKLASQHTIGGSKNSHRCTFYTGHNTEHRMFRPT